MPFRKLESRIESYVVARRKWFEVGLFGLFAVYLVGVIWFDSFVPAYIIMAFPFVWAGIFIWLYGRVLPKYRTEVAGQIADKYELKLIPDISFGDRANLLPLEFEGFDLFQRSATNRRLQNVLHGTYQGVKIASFDYSTYWASQNRFGKRSNEERYTVVCLQFDEPRLPAFTLYIEHPGRKIQAMMGHTDIDFPEHRRFSNMYMLSGEDEPTIRRIFTEKVVEYCEQAGKQMTSIEATTNSLLIYRHGFSINSPEEIQQFLEEGLQLLDRFHEALK